MTKNSSPLYSMRNILSRLSGARHRYCYVRRRYGCDFWVGGWEEGEEGGCGCHIWLMGGAKTPVIMKTKKIRTMVLRSCSE